MKSLNLELLELEAATFEVVDSLDPSMDMMTIDMPDAGVGACSSSCSCSSCCSCSTSSCCSCSSSSSSCA